nr:galactose ABC transporter substrate-binding protein [uncultured Agathobaculum sp.]
MKKKLLSLLLAGAMTVGLAACGNGGDTPAETPSDNPDATASDANVAVFYYAYSDAFISSVRSALDTALTGAGIEPQNFDGNSSQTTQNEYITTALANGANILLVNLVDTASIDTANAIIEQADAVGAQVVFFNRAVEGTDQEGVVLNAHENVAFVGTDAPEAGHLQGEMIGNYLVENFDAVDLNGDGQISYAMFMGQVGNVEAIYRTQYSVEDANAILAENGHENALVYFDASNPDMYQADQAGNWSAQAALEYMQTNLSQYSEANGNMIELVICNNDNMAEGAISALQAAGYNTGEEGSTTIPVFGVDATDSAKALIADGYMTGTVEQSATGMANALLGMVQNISAGMTMDEAVAAVAQTDTELYSVSDAVANKLYVAYSAYTG